MFRPKKEKAEDSSFHLKTIQEFLDASDAAVLLVTPGYEIGYMNSEAELIWGKVTGQPCHEALRKRREPCPECPLPGVLESKSLVKREMRMPTGEGWTERENLYMHVTGPVTGTPFMAVVSTDMPERRTLAREVRRERELSKALLESVNALVVGFDSRGGVTFVNRAAEQVSGYTEAEIKAGGGIRSLVPDEFQKLAREYFESSSDEPRAAEAILIPIVNKSGMRRMISWTYSPLLVGKGQAEGAIALGQDVTERFARRREAEKLAEELLVVNTILSRASSSTDIDDMLELALTALLTLPSYRCGAAYRLERGGAEGHRVASKGFERAEPGIVVMAVPGVFPATAVYDMKIELVDSAETRMHPNIKAAVELEGLGGVIGIPIFSDGVPVGMLLLGHDLDPEKAAVGLDLLRGAADALELGVENAHLRLRAEERAREATALLRVAQSLTGTLDLESSLMKVAAEAGELIGVDLCDIWLLDAGENDTLRLAAGDAWVASGEGRRVMEMSPNGAMSEARATLRPVVIDDALQDPRIPDYVVRERGVRSSLVVPLATEGRFIGAISLDMTSRRRRFTQHESELMESFASQASIAIRSASLVDELRESEERYRALADNSLFGLLVHDGTEIIYANDRVFEMSGYDREEIRTLEDVWEALAPEVREPAAGLLDQLLETGESPPFYDLHLKRKDGGALAVQTLNRRLELGGRTLIMVTIVDVTQRETAEEALKSSEEKYRALVESSRDAIFVTSPHGEVLFANSASVRLMGEGPESLVGRNIYSVVHPSERKQVIQRFSRGWQTGEGVERYPIHVVVDGEDRFFEATTAVLGEAGPDANAMVIVSDVTEREQAQRLLAESEGRYRTIVETSRDLIVMVNRAGEILYVNPASAEVFGYTQEEVLGMYLVKFIHPEDRERAARDFQNDWKTGRTIPNYPVKMVDKDGRLHHVETSSGLVGWPGEDSVQIFVVRDVTERKQREAERELQLRVEEAVAAIATRFVNPGDVYGAITETLEGVGELLGLGRVFYLELTESGSVARVVDEWVAEGVQPITESLLGLAAESFSWWLEALSTRTEIAFESTDDIPPSGDHELIGGLNITGIAVAPVLIRHRMAGVVGFNSREAPHGWSIHELNLLREMSRTVSQALERKEFVEELGRSERFRTRITESIGEGLSVLANGVITWVNRQVCEMYGYEPEELIGKTLTFLLLDPGRLGQIAEEMQDALARDGVYMTEERVKRKDGSVVDVVTSVTPLGTTGEGADEVLVSVKDITESKRMQEEVAAAAEAYSTLFSSAGDALLVHTTEGEILDANERATLDTGYGREELLGMNMRDLVREQLRPLYEERREEVLRNGTTTFEVPLIRKNGGRIPMEVTVRETRISGERVILSALRNIAERRKAEEETRRRARQLASLNEIVQAATSSLDLDTVAETILHVTAEVLGAEFGMVLLESAPGKGGFVPVALMGDVTSMGALMGDAARRGFVMEIAATRPESVILDVEGESAPGLAGLVASALRGTGVSQALLIPLRSGEKTMGFIGLGTREPGVFDMRDRSFYDAAGAEIGVSLENALIYHELAAEHERLSLLYRSAQGISSELELGSLLTRTVTEAARAVGARYAMIALVEAGSNDFRWSASYNIDLQTLEDTPLSREVGIGSQVLETKRALLAPEEHQLTAELRAVLEGDPLAGALGILYGAAVPLVSGDKVLGVLVLHMERGGKELSNEDQLLLEALGRQAGVAIENARLYEETRRHLEALEAAHRELMALDRMKSDFVSTVSHELRSPLAVIEGFAKTMVEHFDQIDRDTEKESLEIILKKAVALEGLIENILDMSRIEEGRLEVARESFELVELCERVRADQELVDETYEVKLDSDSQTIVVHADREKTEVALGNLLRNAVKFSPEGGVVYVKVRQVGPFAVVSVTDQGIGIPADELERIFDRFYQVDSSETRSFPGSGLGLYITKELVQAMGGSIEVESEPGRGSVFTFTLPLMR
jgi:PAS domain S-box-containing protein